jgi:DNA polymerase III sliding clamp (beta) subunit (PCNA family)
MIKSKRLKLVEELKSLSDNKDFFANDGVLFDGNKYAVIWTGVEENFKDYEPLVDYWSGKVNSVFQKFLDKHKLSYEFYDAGTLMIYDDR